MTITKPMWRTFTPLAMSPTRIQLTPVAIEEGMCIANNLFSERPKRHLDYTNIATAVFCQPNIGTVGLTEAEAVALYKGDLDIYESTFKPMKHTLSGRDERTFMKMIVRRSTDVVLAIHMVGARCRRNHPGYGRCLSCGRH